jgi:NTE family protein
VLATRQPSLRAVSETTELADLPTFVLSGGGNLGAVQVGMIYALIERGIRPGMIVGTSVGAINGSFLATRADLDGVDEIARFWSSLRRRDVFGIGVLPLALGLVRQRNYLFDSRPMRRALGSFLGFDRLEEAPIPLAVVATALGTGEPVVLESGDAVTAVLASAAIPRVLPPVEIGGRLLVDGAAAADVPLRQAVSLGARNLYVLPTAAPQLARMQPPEQGTGETPAIHVMNPPDVHVPLGDLSQSRRLIDLGYAQASSWIEANYEPM